MFEVLSYERFEELADSHQRIAVYKEIPGDQLTPINAYLALQGSAKEITLLESVPKEKTLGRYSHICFDPAVVIKSHGNFVTIKIDGKTKTIQSDPFDILREYQSKFFAKTDHPLSGFAGGMVGFMGYDAIRLIEDIPNHTDNVDNIPDIFFRFYPNNITFDHKTEKVIISTVVDINDDLQKTYEQAIKKIDKTITQLFAYKYDNYDPSKKANPEPIQVSTDIEDQDYREMVEKAKQYIEDGDVFQVVLSRQFRVKVSANPFDMYRALRFSNPSPYMFYIDADDYAIAGASPEKLISIKNGIIESCPLAGTRPRDKQRDDKIAKS